MKTLIIGASGKIGRLITNFKNNNKNNILTYNKNKISGGIHFDITKNNLNFFFEKFPINKVVLLSAISDPDECYKINLHDLADSFCEITGFNKKIYLQYQEL